MKTKTDQERYYRQSSLPFTTFLLAKGGQIAGINPTDEPGKKSFCFVRTPELEGLIYAYQFGDKDDEKLSVNARDYEQARRQLLDLLKNGDGYGPTIR